MSSPKKDITKVSEAGVVTDEALLAYVRNELSAADKQEFEKLLLDDPFAQDALDGLLNVSNNAQISTTLTTINRKVKERSGLKEKKALQLHWTSYAWAAVVLGLLIGIGFLMVNYIGNKNDTTIAVNEPPQEATQIQEQKPAETPVAVPAITNDSASANTTSEEISDTAALIESTASQEQALSKGANNSTAKEPPVSLNPNFNKSTTTTAAPAGATAPAANRTATIQQPATGAANNMQPLSIAADKNKTAAKTDVAKTEAEKKVADGKDAGNLEDAMTNFNSGEYKKASEQFDKILQQDPNNIDALYFGGISDYIDGRSAKSEKNFDKLMKKGSKFSDGAKWYKANILSKKGDIEGAKNLLKDLSNSNSSYKERATKKLAELGF